MRKAQDMGHGAVGESRRHRMEGAAGESSQEECQNRTGCSSAARVNGKLAGKVANPGIKSLANV